MKNEDRDNGKVIQLYSEEDIRTEEDDTTERALLIIGGIFALLLVILPYIYF